MATLTETVVTCMGTLREPEVIMTSISMVSRAAEGIRRWLHGLDSGSLLAQQVVSAVISMAIAEVVTAV
jgi:hypothetical protein